MAFWNKIFGGGKQAGDATVAEVDHEGYSIAATPIREGTQYRLAATISKSIDGEVRSHHMIRADLFSSAEDAAEAAIGKAKRVIREQGDSIFEQNRPNS
jgi:hypothetical protein